MIDLLELEARERALKAGQEQLILDRKALIAQKSAFFEQTASMTRKIQRAEKLYDLAVKMKKQIDEGTQ